MYWKPAGIFILAVGATNIGLRNNLACVGATDNPLLGGCQKGDAAEIKSLEESGNALLIAGWISLGVGVAGLLVGGIWIMAHHTKQNKKQRLLSPSDQQILQPHAHPRSAKILLSTQ